MSKQVCEMRYTHLFTETRAPRVSYLQDTHRSHKHHTAEAATYLRYDVLSPQNGFTNVEAIFSASKYSECAALAKKK